MKKLLLISLLTFFIAGYAAAQNRDAKTDPNTIARTENGTAYSLTSIGDKLPRLFVNDKEVPPGRLNDYAPIIEKLENELRARQKKQAQMNDAENGQRVTQIVDEMVSQKIIPSAGALLSFRLDGGGFVVNGKKQSFDTFTRFKHKFINSPDQVYQFNN